MITRFYLSQACIRHVSTGPLYHGRNPKKLLSRLRRIEREFPFADVRNPFEILPVSSELASLDESPHNESVQHSQPLRIDYKTNTLLEAERGPAVMPRSTQSGLSRSSKPRAVISQAQKFSTPPILVTFDAFDTLFEPREPVATQYADVATSFGLQLKEDDVSSKFKDAFRYMNETFPNYGKDYAELASPRVWWEIVIERTLEPLVPSEFQHAAALKDALYQRFSSSEGYKLYKDVNPLFKTIRGDYRVSAWAPRSTMLGIVSNSDPRVQNILESLGLETFPAVYPPTAGPSKQRNLRRHRFAGLKASFAFITLSYHAGIAKPDPAIFETALDHAQTALDGIACQNRLTRTGKDLVTDVKKDLYHVHIGNELEKDVLAALRAGWDALLLDRSEKKPISEREAGDGTTITVINSLKSEVLQRVLTRERMEATAKAKQAPRR